MADISEISSLLSIFTVILCFSAMAVFIMRLGINPLPTISSSGIGDGVPVTAMVGVRNPFILEVVNTQQSSLNSGVKLKLSTEVTCNVEVYWGLEIKSLYYMFTKHGTHVEMLQDDTSMHEDDVNTHDGEPPLQLFIGKNQPISLEVCEGEILELKPHVEENENGKSLDFGRLPRTRYPLVVMMSVAETEQVYNDYDSGSDIVAMVTAVHLPDDSYSAKSHLILQMVKNSAGTVCNLEKFYMSVDESEASSETLDPQLPVDDLTAETLGAKDCTVCQNAGITRVLLPCRHACVCDHCFPLLKKCPMCRGHIESFFHMYRNYAYETYDDTDSDLEEEVPTLLGKFERARERLNQWLDFTN
uniref:Cell growth regulator with RING finger domain protein 1-like n=1 Tax=Saccoglossus kowalevskii TaxID=10224 RepID=A0ABM0GQQ2_SACKO|nr:PREDICTED: cell growth regulator with RING finger domain protein 1-like [Saccoglossus kowalevskii]